MGVLSVGGAEGSNVVFDTAAGVAAKKLANDPYPAGKVIVHPSTGSVLGVMDGGGNLSSATTAENISSAVNAEVFGKIQTTNYTTTTFPSPYDAATFAELPARVQAQITAESKQAAWEAMTAAQRREILHPSLVAFSAPWNGYRYWCAYTPYPSNDSSFENPCIVASNDLTTWVVPAGAENPLFASPAGTEYSSDTDLAYDATNNQLVLLYRCRSATTNTLKISTSPNGGTWAAATSIWTGLIASNSDIATPSIGYNARTSKWEIFGINVDGGASWPFVVITSSSLLSGWDVSPATLTLPHPLGAGRRFWNSHVRRLADGFVVGYMQDNNGIIGAEGDIYSVRSGDGLVFQAQLAIKTSAGLYRATWARINESGNDFVMLANGLNTSSMFVRFGRFGEYPAQESDSARLYSILSTVARAPAISTLADNFTRADASAGANPVGTSSGGQTWTNHSGTNTIGINTNRAYNVTTGSCRATIDHGLTDFDMFMHVHTVGTEVNMLLRFVDTSNYLRYRLVSGSLQEVVAGSATTVATSVELPASGVVLRAKVTASVVRIWINGRLTLDYSTTVHATATKSGIQMSGASVSYVNAIAVVPA